MVTCCARTSWNRLLPGIPTGSADTTAGDATSPAVSTFGFISTDCFNTQRPACPGGDTLFHEECVAGERSVDDGRLFDTIQNQTVANGDAEGHIVLKIDVEGAEWDSFLRTPDALLERIDQIAVEFHGVGEDRFVDTVRHLKRFFFVASLHFNNYSCSADIQPFPAWAYEVLFVNKRLGVLDPSPAAVRMSPLHALNAPDLEDCQAPRP